MNNYFHFLSIVIGWILFLSFYTATGDKPIQDNQTDQKIEAKKQILNSKQKFLAPVRAYLKILKEERQSLKK